jgi:hypothetical protein
MPPWRRGFPTDPRQMNAWIEAPGGMRIAIPHRPKDGDAINIMGESFVFRLDQEVFRLIP